MDSCPEPWFILITVVVTDLEIVDPVEHVTSELERPQVPRLLGQGVEHSKLGHSLARDKNSVS